MTANINDPAFLNALLEQERQKTKTRSPMRSLPMLALAIAYLVPFYLLLVTVLKSTEEYAKKGILELPDGIAPLFGNLRQAWEGADLGRAAFNSLTYATLGSIVAVAVAAAAAYGMTRLRLLGSNAWFMVIFTGTLFPFQMYLVPLLFGFQQVGMVNTWFGMLLVYIAICIPFPLLVLRNSFSGITREIDEAARIEGAGEWRVFTSMILPNASGPLLALTLLQFTFIWNDLLFSSVLATGNEVRSVMVALQALQGTYSTLGPNVVAAGAIISSVPTVALFVVLRKYFMQGLSVGAD
ncbi:carbohydrate ABC transporter permease [Halocynthiibacter sp. C4]|uniref:carbohydrate ABC transporter permease n=1 Tax=Halocynthiibacter sp. C4 TaxID=2992758 RepID=UPI00237BF838|nr:carbohydrate ABC transporter permease [Halocynthiibacter sp. C4]MDE0591482.1 carbohydrate ABC transporter permease [Halocynthiibacter sp. C4]